MNPFRHFDGMCWPAPSERLGDCAHALSHAIAFDEMKREMLVAASVIAAYQELIRLPARKRDAIIRELRKGPSPTKTANPKEPEQAGGGK